MGDDEGEEGLGVVVLAREPGCPEVDGGLEGESEVD